MEIGSASTLRLERRHSGFSRTPPYFSGPRDRNTFDDVDTLVRMETPQDNLKFEFQPDISLVDLPRHLKLHLPRLRYGQKIDGKYMLREFLGAGGMGLLLKAKDIENGEVLAIKLSDEEHLGYEIKALKMLSGVKGVVGFRGEGTVGILRYLAMEYIEGNSLREKIDGEKMPLLKALEIVSSVCFGLSGSAEKGIFHKDIKSANIMLRKDNGEAVLIDFGHSLLPQSGGTPYYMSPEQAAGAFLDQRSDIYSLGLVFYEMLTGSLPYDKKVSPKQVLIHKMRGEQLPLLPDISFDYNIQKAVQNLLNKMTAVDPEKRYDNYSELLGELKGISVLLKNVSDLAPIELFRKKGRKTPAPLCLRVAIPIVEKSNIERLLKGGFSSLVAQLVGS